MTGVRVTYWPAASSPIDAGHDAILWVPTNEKWDGKTRLIVACHGRGETALQYTPNHATIAWQIQNLVATGRYMVVATADRGNTWGSPQAQNAIAASVSYARTRGCKAGRYGLLGYSMGGMAVANHLRANKASIAATQTYAGAMDAGFVWGAGNATWTSDLTGIYTSLANHRSTGFDPYNRFVAGDFDDISSPWRIVHSVDDPAIDVSVARAHAGRKLAQITYTELATGGHFPFTAESPKATADFFDTGVWT